MRHMEPVTTSVGVPLRVAAARWGVKERSLLRACQAGKTEIKAQDGVTVIAFTSGKFPGPRGEEWRVRRTDAEEPEEPVTALQPAAVNALLLREWLEGQASTQASMLNAVNGAREAAEASLEATLDVRVALARVFAYQARLQAWLALPWWRRAFTKPPEWEG